MNTYSSSSSSEENQKRSKNSSIPFLTENEAEVARLLLLHRRLTELMGGVLLPLPGLSQVHRVLDVGCGVGAWAYEMAWRHPDMQVVGIDKSAFFINQAQKHIFGYLPNLTYMAQDMQHLEGEMFAPGSFDLSGFRPPQATSLESVVRRSLALALVDGMCLLENPEMETPSEKTPRLAYQRDEHSLSLISFGAPNTADLS